MIAILGALREEVSCLRKRMDVQETIFEAACIVFRGTWGGRDILLVQTGMGKQRAQAATRLVFERYPVDSLVSFGFAGALAEELRAGDVVLYSAVHCAETDADPEASPEQSYASSDDVLAQSRRALEGAAVTFTCEPGVSVRQIALSPEERAALAKAHQAHVVDMESYWIAEIATEAQISFVTLRSVSDTRHEKLLPFDQLMTEDGKVRWRAAAAYFVRRPHHLAVVGRLYRNMRLAQQNLATAVDALISKL